MGIKGDKHEYGRDSTTYLSQSVFNPKKTASKHPTNGSQDTLHSELRSFHSQAFDVNPQINVRLLGND